MRKEQEIFIPLEDGEELADDDPKRCKLLKNYRRVEYVTPSAEADLFLDLLRKIFKDSPQERLCISKILAHPWLANEVGTVQSAAQDFLQSNPSRTYVQLHSESQP